MIVGNCHPTVTGLSIEATDKMIFSNLASKVATVKEWCRECPISRECAVQGFWTNEDGKETQLTSGKDDDSKPAWRPVQAQ